MFRAMISKPRGGRAGQPVLWRLMAVLPFVLAAGMLPAQVRQEGGYWVKTEQGAVAAANRLRISTVGAIALRGEQHNQVRYEVQMKLRARNRDEAEELFAATRFGASTRVGTVTLSLDDPNCGRCNFSASLTVRAPIATRETILSTSGGSLDVHRLEGRVNAETSGGSITMGTIGGAVQAETAGGSITLESIGGPVRCETAGGSISLRGAGSEAVVTTSGGSITAENVRGGLRAETAGGGITASNIGGGLMAGTSGGSIELAGVAGPVRAETAGGSIRVKSAPRGVNVETAGGSIELQDVAGAVRAANASGTIRAAFLPGQALLDSFLETTAGTIIVWLPDNVQVTIDASVDLADSAKHIQTDFSAISIEREAHGFGPSLVRARGALNGGGPVLRIRNTNGRIQIRRLGSN